MEEWNENHWKVHVREGFDGKKRYDLKAPSVTYVFGEHDFLQLTRNINAVAEHIHDKEYYYIHDGDIFRRDGGQLLGVIEDCEELNRLYKENIDLKRFKEVVFDLLDKKVVEFEEYLGYSLNSTNYQDISDFINHLKEIKEALQE